MYGDSPSLMIETIIVEKRKERVKNHDRRTKTINDLTG